MNSQPRESDRLLSRIDHFFVPLVDPEAAFGLLTNALELPIAWSFSSFGSFASGGVNLGNANLELLSGGPGAAFAPRSPALIQGIALDCGSIDQELINELDRRGIGHGPPLPFMVGGKLRWTNLSFTDVSDDQAMIYACDYVDPAARDLERRARELSDKHGGRLGAIGVSEIVVCSDDVALESARWAKLLGPALRAAEPLWTFSNGPALRIEAGQERTIGLVIAVSSAALANRALAAADMRPLAGLRLGIVERALPPC